MGVPLEACYHQPQPVARVWDFGAIVTLPPLTVRIKVDTLDLSHPYLSLSFLHSAVAPTPQTADPTLGSHLCKYHFMMTFVHATHRLHVTWHPAR